MYPIIFIVYFGAIASTGSVDFKWIEFNELFDCVVGISVQDKPISVGVFVSSRTIITAANPLNDYIYKKGSASKVKIHAISNLYNESKTLTVQSLEGNQALRKQSWVQTGYNDTTHTTIHDILLINIIEDDKISPNSSDNPRRPYSVRLPTSKTNDDDEPDGNGWVFVGFGYVDEEHVKANTELEVSFLEESTLTDCDEWLPREWGRFICLRNAENVKGVASGSPLFNNVDMNTVVGIGSFSLKKGNEEILVFTDLSVYVDHLYGYIKDPIKKNSTDKKPQKRMTTNLA